MSSSGDILKPHLTLGHWLCEMLGHEGYKLNIVCIVKKYTRQGVKCWDMSDRQRIDDTLV